VLKHSYHVRLLAIRQGWFETRKGDHRAAAVRSCLGSKPKDDKHAGTANKAKGAGSREARNRIPRLDKVVGRSADGGTEPMQMENRNVHTC
jgi:hypothetical protein